MSASRDFRRCALQCLYQFDARGSDQPDVVRTSLDQSPGGLDAHEAGFNLACLAWEHRAEADAAIEPLTPEWPIRRQPVVDRSILRLAYYEMVSGRTPPKVAINEAVELAKEFSTDKSPMFINGVLDKVYRQLRDAESGGETAVESVEAPQPTNAGREA